MSSDHTSIDSQGIEILKKALNQRVIVTRSRIVPSNRNRVWFVETDVRPVVVKRSFSGRSPVEFETMLLAKKAGVDVPYPLYMDKHYLVTEFVAGESCDLLINHMFSHDAAGGLGRWFASFHERLESFGRPLVMADATLQNFIMQDDRIYGFDLEDASPGEPLDDLGQMAASILGNEPFFTPIKFDLCFTMLEGYEDESGLESLESVRPYVAKHLRNSVRSKPLFRRPFEKVALTLERGWPSLA